MKKLLLTFILLLSITGCEDSGGVLLSNEISNSTIIYLEENKVLNQNEEIIAYYDVTITLNNSESAILTDKRVIYYNEGSIHSIRLDNIKNIEHETSVLLGDIITIESLQGKFLKITIAPFNQGNIFLDLLYKKINKV